MKTRKSKAYLVIGNAHLGTDDNILELFANVANHYDAEVVHLGPLVTEKEVNPIQDGEVGNGVRAGQP